MSTQAPPITDEQLSKRWPAKFAKDCNVCRRPYDLGEKIGIDPAKPYWFNQKAQKWQNNYAHASCIDANDRQMGRAPEQSAVKPFSFAPNASAQGDLTKLLTAFRDAINDYLGEIDADAAYRQLDGEIPL